MRAAAGADGGTRAPGVHQSNWPQPRRRHYAEGGMEIVDKVLNDLRADLRTNLFLYEQTAAMEPLLLVISTQVLLQALRDDVREGRRMNNREIDRECKPTVQLPVEEGVRKVPARVQLV